MSTSDLRRYALDDFGGGIVTALPEHALPDSAVPYMKNVVVDDDGGLLALPWQLALDAASFSGAPAEQQQLSLAPSYDDIGGEFPTGWLTRVDDLRMYNRIGGVTPWRQSSGVTGVSGYGGLSNVVHYNGKNYWAGHKVGTEFQIFSTKAGTPSVVTKETVAPVTSGYNVGARFPLFVAVHREHFWVAGDASDAGAMRSDVYASAPADPTLVSVAASPGWGKTIIRAGYTRGDAITGLRASSDALFVFKTRSVTRLDGVPTQYTKTDLLTGLGCIAPGSLAEYADSYVFLSHDGFVQMRPGGQHEFISAPVQSRVRGAIDALQLNPLGWTRDLRGHGLVHGNRYWFLWPSGELWCFDLLRRGWCFFDAGCNRSDADNDPARYDGRGFLLTPFAGRWPSVLHAVDTAGILFRHAARTDNYEATNIAPPFDRRTYYPPAFETKVHDFGFDGWKRVLRLRILCELGSVPATTGSLRDKLNVLLVDEAGNELGRGYLSGNTGAGIRKEFVVELTDGKPVRLAKIRLVSAQADTLDRRTPDKVSYFRLHRMSVEYVAETNYIEDASQTAVTALVTGARERWEDAFDDAALDAQWVDRGVRGNIVETSGYWTTPGAQRFGAGLVVPGLDAARVYEVTWDPLESTCRHASLSIL